MKQNWFCEIKNVYLIIERTTKKEKEEGDKKSNLTIVWKENSANTFFSKKKINK